MSEDSSKNEKSMSTPLIETTSSDSGHGTNYSLKVSNFFYSFQILLWAIICLVILNFKNSWLTKITKIHGDSQYEIGASFTCRASFGLFIWYVIHSLVTICNPNLVDSCQFIFHSKWLSLHFLVLKVFIIGSMFLPENFVEVWMKISMFVSAVFLLLQLISLVAAVYELNDQIISSSIPECYLYVIFFLGCGISLCIFIVNFIIFDTQLKYYINSFFLFAAIVMVFVSCVKEAALVGVLHALYVAVLSFVGFNCFDNAKNSNTFSLNKYAIIASSVFSLVWLIISTFRLSKNNELTCCCQESDDTPEFSLSYFHGVYSGASAYFGMVMTNWLDGPSAKDWDIGMGETSMWINFGVALATIGLFSWTVVAPNVCVDRDFS